MGAAETALCLCTEEFVQGLYCEGLWCEKGLWSEKGLWCEKGQGTPAPCGPADGPAAPGYQ